MTDLKRLEQMRQIAVLLRDRDLTRLATATSQKHHTEGLLAQLDKAIPAAGLDLVVASQVTDRFGLWTTNRRILLNQQLARDTVDWLSARSQAQVTFGRAEVLGKLKIRK